MLDRIRRWLYPPIMPRVPVVYGMDRGISDIIRQNDEMIGLLQEIRDLQAAQESRELGSE